jgi:Flp pilus assembly protein TadB
MNQISDLFASLTPQMKMAGVFFLVIGVVVIVITQKLIQSSVRDRLLAVLKGKQVGVSERAASVILNVERQGFKNSGRLKKIPFDMVNFRAISRDMRKAGLPPIPPLIFLSAGFLSFLIARFIINAPIYPLYIQAVALYLPVFFLVRKSILEILVDSRKMKSLTQLIAFIESVQRAVSVGTSPDEAVAEAIGETEKPLRDSLIQVKEVLDLGYDFIDAINLAAEQVDLPEFDVFAASLTAQASTGGAIGDVLRDVVDIARSRMDLKKKISTMTAEGRFNAILLGSLPIGLTQFLRASEPDYFNQIWDSDFLGPAIFFGTFGLAASGALLAMRIAKISI